MSAYGDGYADRYDPYGAQAGRHDDRGGYGDDRGGFNDRGGYGGQGGQGGYGDDRGGQGGNGDRGDSWGERGERQEPGFYDQPRGYPAGDYDELPGGADQDEARRGKRMLLVAGIGAVALVVVGAVAFGGSLLLSKSSNAAPQSNVAAGAAASIEAGDLFGGASGDPSAAGSDPAGNATSAAPTTKAATPAPKTTAPTAKKTTAAPGGGSNVAYENQVLALVNTERGKAGCQPLNYNAKLRAAAYKHSADMAAHNYFSHDSQDGTSFATRISNEGYRWSNAAENIAKGQRTPEEVMNAWMNSAGHKANILNCKLKDLGVGLAYQGKTAIWTQDFGTQM
ncbi:CAP domain-containing protein [Dactylosporangium sp. McL0621]|uniref:CAP domain-containing protein n=1 Tax=Dactylosporangium sp. McL0621 TaxID=3415678 RepID=UPI003CF88B54